MKKRVVITGIGIVAPNGVGKEAFKTALENGTSGIKFDQQLADLVVPLLELKNSEKLFIKLTIYKPVVWVQQRLRKL